MRSLFVIGDSISIQYGPYLKQLVDGQFHYDRKRGEQEALLDLDRPIGANGGDSSMVRSYLLEQLVNSTTYDLLLLNCGLHDIKTDPITRAVQVSAEQYRTNLEEIATLASQMSSNVIWIRTTDVVDQIHNERSHAFHRFHADVIHYNEIADQVFKRYGISSIDLYHFTRIFGDNAYNDHVHFTNEVSQMQAAYIAGYLHSRRELIN